MITEDEYQKARKIVSQYRAEKSALKYQNALANVSKDTMLQDCQLCTRTRNLMFRAGRRFLYEDSYSGVEPLKIKLKEFEGLSRRELMRMSGMGPISLMEIDTLLEQVGVKLKEF